jgi:hypothetical protein
MLMEALAVRAPAYPFAPTTVFPAAPPPRGDRLKLGTDVARILARASRLARKTNATEGLVRARDLFGALLNETGTPVHSALAGLLETRGYFEPVSLLGKQVEQFLVDGSSQSLREFLAAEVPFSLTPQALPRYDTDAVGSAGAGRAGDGEPHDLVGITPEVDALAHLLAAKDLQPPLAIGLFGDWGAGKTYFMRALQRRIYRITAAARSTEPPRAQRDLPIFKSVAQIEFNAWHYVEGNLWASLVEHIFRNLQTREGDRQSDLDDRRRALAAQVKSTDDAKQRLQEDITRLEARKAEAAREEERLRLAREEAVRQAGAIGPITASILREAATEESVRDAMESLGLTRQWSTVTELRAALTDARATVERGFGIVDQLRAQPVALVAIAGLAVVGLPLLSAWLLSSDVPALTTAIATITAAITGATAIIARGTAWTRDRLRELETVEAVVGRAERTDDAEHRVRVQELQAIDQQLIEARDRAAQLERRADDLRASILELTPGQVLTRFIDERAGSDDYRKHLGVPAIIRRDFEELWRDLDRLNQEFITADDGKEPPSRHAVNRIVLYIDDLDRCPPPVVINVLQAVHLLLAFPLFVVVVAVDSRWLSNSLQQHYPHLIARHASSNGAEHDNEPDASVGARVPVSVDGQATPDDYLEKIFQVPIWIRPLDPAARRQIVDGLIAPSLLFDGGDGGGDASATGEARVGLDAATRRALAGRLFGRDGGDSLLDPMALGILRHEQEFMGALAPLLGESPRAVKRFVNVYRLVKALEEPRSSGFTSDRPFSDHQLVLFLLAVLTGLPDIAPRVWTGIRHPQPGLEKLGPLARRIEEVAAPGDEREQAHRLVGWLSQGPVMGGHWDTMHVSSLADWQPSIGRFTFGSEIAEAPLPAAANPPPPGTRPARSRAGPKTGVPA